jgi:hypothetical protein
LVKQQNSNAHLVKPTYKTPNPDYLQLAYVTPKLRLRIGGLFSAVEVDLITF